MMDMQLYEVVKPLAKNFPIKFSFGRGRGNSPTHWHEAVEMLYFKEEGAAVFCNGRFLPAQPGDLFIFNSKELHGVENRQPTNYVCIRFLPQFFADLRQEDFQLQALVQNDPTVEAYMNTMIALYTEKAEDMDLRVKGESYLFFSYLLRRYKAAPLSEEDVSRRRKQWERISTILQYIGRNFDRPLTTASLAERFFLDESYLCNIFKSETGQSPLRYINAFRVEKAAVLLGETDQSVTHIAARVGFDDPNYFARIFRRQMGCSPREYRRTGGHR